MDAFDAQAHRALDQPQSIEVEALDPAATWLLANPELRFAADAQSDLRDLRWPWAGARYAQAITTTLAAFHGDALLPLVNRYYPGYQETIYGSEGLILSKRLVAPFRSADDRALLWSYECQAEGDAVLRFDVQIDWGEPLTQRMVDGLLVAQHNPRARQGIYKQSNADSTRIFGNPHGQPESVQLDDAAGTAHLVYYVLVNGIVDVSLLLTVSDVGEQVAWNSFLALRDTERTFDLSNRAWEDALKVARVWTPDARLNHALQAGKRAALQQVVHLRTGIAPADRQTTHVPALVDALDALDPAQSRNLLAHLRRAAERSQGRLPLELPALAKAPLADPGPALVQTNGAYLAALLAHLGRHPEPALLEEHFASVARCAEMLVQARPVLLQQHAPAARLMQLGAALRAAMSLATLQRDGVNAVRWESEACDAEQQGEAQGAARAAPPPPPDWAQTALWHTPAAAPWGFADVWTGIGCAAQAIWQGCGISLANGQPAVRPTWPAAWGWWALLDLPLAHTTQTPASRLTLVWDGATLHATEPLRTALPVAIHASIRALHSDELDFDLTFEFTDISAGERTKQRFRPPQWP